MCDVVSVIVEEDWTIRSSPKIAKFAKIYLVRKSTLIFLKDR